MWTLLDTKAPEADRLLKCAPAMVFELPKHSNYRFKRSQWGSRNFDPSRLPDMATIYIMYQAPVQCYRAQQLDYCVHYQIAQERLELIHSECRRLRGNSLYAPEVVVIPPDEDFEDEFLLVRNNPSPDKIAPLDFLEVMKFVLDKTASDKSNCKNSRRTPRIDLGTTGHNNSRRDRSKTGLGLPKPYRFAHTDSEEGKAILLGSSEAFKAVFHDQADKYFCDAERNALFANTYAAGSISESLAALVADLMIQGQITEEHYTAAHTDSNNDRKDPRYRVVIGFSGLLYNKELDSLRRSGTVMYGKLSGGDFMDKLRRYGPLLSEMYDTWDHLPPWQKNVDSTLIPGPDHPSGRTLEAPHSLKTVLYSVFADTIDKVLATFTELAKEEVFVAGLLFCTTVSNCPQHFWFELRKIAEDRSIGTKSINDMDAVEAVTNLYNHLYNVKAKDHPMAAKYEPRPRHQPCHNQRASKVQILNSVHVIARLMRDLRSIPPKEFRDDPPFFYHSATMVLTRKCISDVHVDLCTRTADCGVYMAGPLIAQHILGTAACLNLIPAPLALHAHIGPSTTTWKYYVQKFHLGEGLQVEHSDIILLAASSYLDIPPVQAEELACLNAKAGARSRFRTQDFIGCCGHLYIPTRSQGRIAGICRINRNGDITPQPQWVPKNKPSRPYPRMAPLWNFTGLSSEKKNIPTKKSKPRKLNRMRLEESFPFIPGEALPVPTPHSIVLSCKPRHATPHAREADFNADVVMRKSLSAYRRYGVDLTEASHRDILLIQKHGTKGFPMPECNVQWGGKRPPKRKRVHGFSNYVSHGIRLGEGKIFYPPTDFPLFPDVAIGHEAESFVESDRRWFRSMETSRLFTILALAGEMGYDDPTGLFSDFFSQSVELKGGRSAKMKVMCSCRRNGQAKKPSGERNVRYERIPFLVGIEYDEGGRAFYLTNSAGCRISSPYLIPKPPSQYMAVYDHETIDGKPFITIRTKETTKLIPLSQLDNSEIHWPVFQYAKRNGLLNQPGWKRFAKIADLLPDTTDVSTSDILRDSAFAP